MPFEYKPEFLYLTTTGWKSGTTHEIEIWYVAYNGCYYLCSERRERSHWVQNVRKHPAVSVYVEGRRFQGTGRVLDPATEPGLTQAVAAAFDAKYDWSDGVLVELCPASAKTEA